MSEIDLVTEDINAVKRGESIFYGYFLKYLWRNEKDGASFFLISTKQQLLFPQQYQSYWEKKNPSTNKNEVWYNVACDGTKHPIPYFPKMTPIRIVGHFLNKSKKNRNWDFLVTEIREASCEETTTINYLASESFPGITYEKAVEIVAYHGADIFSFIQQPDAAKQLMNETGLPFETIELMFLTIKQTQTERKMFEFLSPLNISYAFCSKLVKHFGTNADQALRENPYKVGCNLGLSFYQCDAIAKKYGYTAYSNERLFMACCLTMERLGMEGHVWYPQRDFNRTLRRILTTDYFPESSSIPLSSIIPVMKKIVGDDKRDSVEIFFSRELKNAEMRIAKNIIRLSHVDIEEPVMDDMVGYAEKMCNMKYGEQQRSAFSMLKTRGVKILTGGPGTGKTTTTKGMLYAYQAMHPDHKICLCAPTGRAAQKLSESTEMPALTIHRLVDYRPYGDAGSYKNANDPIDADLIVVDEMSMTNIEIFDILLEAVKTGTTLILIGDIHQLEAVGAGSILHDLLDVPQTVIQRTMLTEVFRQKGGSPIIENSFRVNDGVVDLETCEDFQIIHTKCEEESLEQIKKLMKELYNPEDVFDTQILCPSRKGVAGINNCNVVLQSLLNPGKGGLVYGSTTYRVNDKVIMTSNNYDESCQYYNGDIGVVKEVTDKGLKVDIRGQLLNIGRDSLDEMKLSYGMTIHKSQGSEFKNVIVVMPMQPSNMLVRNLFYTAITRAKKRVFIINEGTAMETAIKRDKSGLRRTTLTSKILELESRFNSDDKKKSA